MRAVRVPVRRQAQVAAAATQAALSQKRLILGSVSSALLRLNPAGKAMHEAAALPQQLLNMSSEPLASFDMGLCGCCG